MAQGPPSHQAPLCRTLTDKFGQPFTIRSCENHHRDFAVLSEMYTAFQPKECAQGLPSGADNKRDAWLRGLLKENLHLLAFVGDTVVGPAVLLEMQPEKSCEYLIFVHQDHQNRGIGTALSQTCKELARYMGYGILWLTVELTNCRAIHVYEKVGFRMAGPMQMECEMVMQLTSNYENS